MFNDKELVNFQSAPLNAVSALNGNKALELRHKKLMDELKATKKNKSKNLKGKNNDFKS
jgi:hypothetical protein